jgi:hypothetical protein
MQSEGWDWPCDRQDAVRFRQNTKYVNEEENWKVLCPACQKANEEYWRDMWFEYYEDCM